VSAKTLRKARRRVEWLELNEPQAGTQDWSKWREQHWAAGHELRDLEDAADTRSVTQARRAGVLMDVTLALVGALVFTFSLGNVHRFALGAEVGDPIAWLLAPAVDLALVAALFGDAVLSRYQLDAGNWAAALRWFAGLATLGLNSWDAWAHVDPAAIVAHTVPPMLLILLAEAAPQYRMRFAETVNLAVAKLAADRTAEQVADASEDVRPLAPLSANRPDPVRPATPRTGERPRPGRPDKAADDDADQSAPAEAAEESGPENPQVAASHPAPVRRVVAASAPVRRPMASAVRRLAADSAATASDAQREQVRAWIAGRIAAGESVLWRDVQDVVGSQWSRSRTWYLARLAEVRDGDDAGADEQHDEPSARLHVVTADAADDTDENTADETRVDLRALPVDRGDDGEHDDDQDDDERKAAGGER
jgi:hypothetical protein